MITLKTNNPKVITNNEIVSIIQLVYSTYLSGGKTPQDEALFDLGFLYDKKTGLVVVTRKKLTWSFMTSKLKFRVFYIDEFTIDDVFIDRREIIMKNNDITEEYWSGLSSVDKLFILEQDNSFLTCQSDFQEFNSSELCSFLETYIDKNYENLK